MRQLYAIKPGDRRPGRPGGLVSGIVFAVILTLLSSAAAWGSTFAGHAKRVIRRDPVETSQQDAAIAHRSTFHPIRLIIHRHPPTSYTVRKGDTLSSIAAKMYGSAKKWPALWWVNKSKVHNPNDIKVGEQLHLSGWHPQSGWIYTAAMKAVPVTVQVQTDSFDTPTYVSASRSAHRASSVTGGAVTAGSSYERCVIARESGGNAQVMNSSGHYGLYQFSASTWQAYGGSADSFGNASPAEQRRVFLNAMAQGGQSNWSPYDGC